MKDLDDELNKISEVEFQKYIDEIKDKIEYYFDQDFDEEFDTYLKWKKRKQNNIALKSKLNDKE